MPRTEPPKNILRLLNAQAEAMLTGDFARLQTVLVEFENALSRFPLEPLSALDKRRIEQAIARNARLTSAARSGLAQVRDRLSAYGRPDPVFRAYGPETRRADPA